MIRAVTTALVLALGADAFGADDPLVLQHLACRGNEPFWSIEMNRTTALTTRLVADREERIYGGALTSLDFLDPPWSVFRGEGADGALVVITRAEPCLDTMADLPPFDRRAVVSFPDGVVATGCCTATVAIDVAAAPTADPASKPIDDWSRFVVDLARPIATCVNDADIAVAVVTVAWPMNHGMAGVRLEDRNGARHDCIAETADGRIDRVDGVAAATKAAGEDDPRFLPARDAPPILTCGHVEAVREPATGAVLGWLHYGGPCT